MNDLGAKTTPQTVMYVTTPDGVSVGQLSIREAFALLGIDIIEGGAMAHAEGVRTFTSLSLTAVRPDGSIIGSIIFEPHAANTQIITDLQMPRVPMSPEDQRMHDSLPIRERGVRDERKPDMDNGE